MDKRGEHSIIAVIGPLGAALTGANLPPRKPKRWVVRRKAEVIIAVNAGLLTVKEACERYELTAEEFLSRQSALQRCGFEGLMLKHWRRP
jgi:Protein of unknown function (DUF1153)